MGPRLIKEEIGRNKKTY